ncbi:unnamed protein product [Callosobruchus maculatus]|uniref:Aftiphilin clathrin-binding box domain-containing protein n=1 Tax=Callosobruchus maculatus TaxID=64391 RepID=A0A653CRS8_CALMS|nr:unnamed protein product [Callosobruchus maculatus]
MSNIIPPLLCNTPPPPPSPDEEDEDEFGDFSGANDYSYGCDNLSLPSTPEDSPKKAVNVKKVDINCNAENKTGDQATTEHVQKDYLDRRKSNDCSDSDKLKYFNYDVDKDDICSDINQDLNVDVSESVISDNINENFPIENSENIVNIEKSDENPCKSERIEDLPLDELSFDSCEQDNEFMKEISDFSDVYRAIEQSGYSNTDDDDEFADFAVNTKTEDVNKTDLHNGDLDIKYITPTTNSKDSETNAVVEKHTDATLTSRSKAGDNIQYNNLFEDNSHLNKDDLTFHPNYESDGLEENNVDVRFDYDFKENVDTEVTSELNFGESTCNNQKLSEEAQVDDDFGDFEAANPNSGDKTDEQFGDFANFATYETGPVTQITASTSSHADDDFGDFASSFDPQMSSGKSAGFSEDPCIKYLELNEKEAYEKAKEIIKDMVPVPEVTGEEVEVKPLGENDFVFNKLKDVTETPALNYQWSKSSSQKALLKALNIDARNILHGPSWNPSMPRFAANLTMEPLEPVKTECVSPSLYKSNPPCTQQPLTPEIPSAQFDWSGSGLTNPLDPISTKTEDITIETIKQTDIPERIQDDSSTNPQPDSFEDFTSYQSTPMPQVSDTWSKQVPLRETYISSSDNHEVVPEVPLNVEAWLQPTIVTPELPRKQIGTEEDIIVEKEVKGDIGLDEFDVNSEVREDVEVAMSVLSKAELSIFDSLSKTEDIITSSIGSSPERAVSKDPEVLQATVESLSNEEDEFTDFQFSIPAAEPHRPPKPLTPILEPLKPVPVISNVVSNTIPAQINWPDPGITDEELKKFDEVFTQPVRQKQSEPTKSSQLEVAGAAQVIKQVHPEAIKPVHPEVARPEHPEVMRQVQPEVTKLAELDSKLHKQSKSFEDDEWTDFMSVQKRSPVHKIKGSGREQTSSPDLTLSVFNLGNIQPTRPPVPVITPKGLVQTKLSSNLNQVPMSPKFTPKNNIVIPQSSYHAPQPSIISHQFASHAYGFSNNLQPTNQSAAAEEDEWGDFVSASSVANGWPTANHHATQQNQIKKAPMKSSVSNLVLPELDFVAPKGRTYNTRNK